MAIIKLSQAFKAFANWISADVLAFIRDQSVFTVDTVADVNGGDFEQARYVYVKDKDAVYRLDLTSGAADDGELVLRDNAGRRYLRIGGKAFDSFTAANIAAIGHAVNTSGKRRGRAVYDSTNRRLMIADGSAANAPWYTASGTPSVTPA